MPMFLPSPEIAKKVKANLDRYTAKIPQAPGMLSEAQIWHRFNQNPDAAVQAVSPDKRGAFLADMARLGAKYNRAPGG